MGRSAQGGVEPSATVSGPWDPTGAPESDLVRRLARRGRLAAILLGILALGGLAIFVAQTRIIQDSTRAIDLAGRQRMLSQRSALLAHELTVTRDEVRRADLRRQLAQIAEESESSAVRLLDPGSSEFAAFRTPGTRAIVDDPPHRLGRRLAAAAMLARDLSEATDLAAGDPVVLRLRRLALRGELVAALDALVSEYREETERRLVRLRWAAGVLVLLTGVLLAGTGLFLFRPMKREFRRQLDELRRSREVLYLTLEHSPLGIATCDADGRILTVNPALAGLFGRRQEALPGSPLLDLVDRRDLPELRSRIREVARGDLGRFSLPCRWRGGDGDELHAVLHCGVILSALRRPRRLIAVWEDRTAQVTALREAAVQRERLAHLTRLATMGELAAGIAHEVNQPLTAIATYAEACRRLIEAGPPRPGLLTDTLAKVGAEARRAGEVIRHLRSFVKKRHSHGELADLNRVVAEAVDLVRAGAGHLQVPIHTELADGLPPVAVDVVQIQQVVLNLVRNALDASDGDDAAVWVRTAAGDDDQVIVSVEDCGEGLSDEAHERLFEPFFTTKSSGLGIGLTLSRSIVTSHGGRLWWEPASERGSLFRFTLPAATLVRRDVRSDAAQRTGAQRPTVATERPG